MNNQNEDIRALLDAILQAEGVTEMTPKRFAHLSTRVFARTRQMIGVTTLKRLFGYVNDVTTPRTVTLDILSQYLGYKTFEDFCRLYNDKDIPSSSITLGECVYVDEMEVGDTYRLTWSPNRVCDVEYQGDFTFVIKDSKLSKLIPGTTFRCQLFEKGEELFLDHVYFDEKQRSPLNYIAGKIGGINYEKL